MNGHFGLFLMATLLMSLSPGPNVLLLVSLGLRDGAAAVLRASGGIAVASMAFLLVSALGLVAVLVASAPVFRALCLAGAAYLAWLGLRMLWSARSIATPDAAVPESRGRPFMQGLVTHLSNPKAVVYWSALLPQFLDTTRPLAPQVGLLGGSGIALDVAVLCGYGMVASAARKGGLSTGQQRVVNIAGGVFFLLAGVLLALAPRQA